jgi:hypothetical protein
VALAIGAAGSAAADPTACTMPDGRMFAVTYFDLDDHTSGTPLCNTAGDLVGCRLAGWFYQPTGAGPFAAIVFNHAGEPALRAESDTCAIVEHFVGLGYVVFVPLRRGYAGDGGLGVNTGELPDETLALLQAGQPSRSPLAAGMLAACEEDGSPGLNPTESACVTMHLQWSQVLEVKAALDFVRGVAAVDPDRIALFGHGSGANITALSALFDALPGVSLGVKAGVLLSPAESSWADNQSLRDLLLIAVAEREFPLAMLQPANAETVEPTRELAHEAIGTQTHELMAALLPPVEGDDGARPTAAQVRRRFATRAKHVRQWAPLAWRFIHLQGVRR